MKNPETLSLLLSLGSAALLIFGVIFVLAIGLRKKRGSPPPASHPAAAPLAEKFHCVLPPRRDPKMPRMGNPIRNRKANADEVAVPHPTSAFWVNARLRRALRQ